MAQRRFFKKFPRRKVCRFCKNKTKIDYKNVRLVGQNGRILPAKITGTCAKHQRQLATAIKRARILALLPFVVR